MSHNAAFVRTSAENYIKNIWISSAVSIIPSFYIYFMIGFNEVTFLIFILYFVHCYRIYEFYLTGKSISALGLFYGEIQENKSAYINISIYFLGIITMTIVILYLTLV
ncbi:MAG: hypothetical protein AABX33_00055 [Nanoarchaeota archaeon]